MASQNSFAKRNIPINPEIVTTKDASLRILENLIHALDVLEATHVTTTRYAATHGAKIPKSDYWISLSDPRSGPDYTKSGVNCYESPDRCLLKAHNIDYKSAWIPKDGCKHSQAVQSVGS